MFEVVVGLLLLFLGWLCFKQVSQARRTYAFSERPPMSVRAALGLLLMLGGAALLALAILERRHAVSGSVFF